MKELIKPSFQTREYSLNDVVFLSDRYQQFLYLKHNAKPVDMYVSTADNNLIMVFRKNETRELYEKYRRFELE